MGLRVIFIAKYLYKLIARSILSFNTFIKFCLNNRKIRAIIPGLLVTFLWSTSFVIIKKGLKDIPPLTFAGLRYLIATIVLLPFLFIRANAKEIKSLKKDDLVKLFLLGILFYSLRQGTQYLGLKLLPSVAVSLLLNFTPVLVAVGGIFLLKEIPSKSQWKGIALFLIGVVVYFSLPDF